MKKVILISISIFFSITYQVIGQNIQFDRSVNITDASLTIEDGLLNLYDVTVFFQDTVGGSVKTNVLFLEQDSLKFLTNLLNEMRIDKNANVRLLNNGTEKAVFINGNSFSHDLAIQDFSNGDQNSGEFIISTREGSTESAGIAGNGATVTIWSPGDTHGGVQAYMVVLDEDQWVDGDTDPYDNTAVKAFLNIAGTWQVSDRRQKSNVKLLDSALDKTMHLNGYSYTYNQNSKEIAKGQMALKSIGVMAQEVEKVIPEAVSKTTNGDYFINYSAITPVLIEAIKDQQEIIEQMNHRIRSLEARIKLLD